MINRDDWEYVPLDPDPDFDEERNKKIIDETIRLNELNRKRNRKKFKQAARERHEAIASYTKHLTTTKSNVSAGDYFGKRHMAFLRGRQIKDIIMNEKKKQKSQEKGGRD